MKKYNLVLTLALVALCFGCANSTKYTKYANAGQNELDSIVSCYNEAHYGANDVKMDEMFTEYHTALKNLFEATNISNWQAKIQSIRMEDMVVNDTVYKRVSFKLIDGLDIQPQITFESAYYVKTDSINTDDVYNKIKELGNLDNVLFSGNILQKKDGSVLTVYESSGKSHSFAYPTFNLMITDICKN